MSDPTVRVLLYYLGTMIVGALAAGLAVLATQLAGTDDLNFRPVIAAMLGPIVAGLLATRLPKPENAALQVQVDHLHASKVPSDRMVALDAGTKPRARAVVQHAEDALAGKSPIRIDHRARMEDLT